MSEGVPPSDFEAVYQKGRAPWDIQKVQPVVEFLVEQGRIEGPTVLDLGCGTGWNAQFLLAKCFIVTGIDLSRTAIQMVKDRLPAATHCFHAADALTWQGGPYNTILDTGVFHVFSDADRLRYYESVMANLAPGGLLHIVVFRQDEPAWGGPRRVSQEELEAFATSDLHLESIEPTTYHVLGPGSEGRAWLASFRKSA